MAVQLAKRDVHFLDIAGNEIIFVTAVVPKNPKFESKEAPGLFVDGILTHPDLKRIAVECPVRSLDSVLNDLQDSGAQDVYDF